MDPSSLEKEVDAKAIEPHVENLLQKMKLTAENINVAPGSSKGDNYLGLIARVRVEAKDNKGEKVVLNWIVKYAPVNEESRKTDLVDKIFAREVVIYEKLFPAFDTLQKDRGIPEPFRFFPPCYHTCTKRFKETLILENMKEKGFELQNRKKSLDYEHVLVALRRYAKFHALSFALKDRQPEMFQELKNEIWTFVEMMSDHLQLFLDCQIREIYKALDPIKDVSTIEKFKKIEQNCLERMREIAKAEECSVFIHGDCWVNNLLFKYGDPTRPHQPTDMCLLDFQISHVSSPATDVLCFLFLNVEGNLRRRNHVVFMKDYHNTLSTFLEELGTNPEKLYPWNNFQKDLRKFSLPALMTSTSDLKIVLSDPDEAPDILRHEDDEDLIKKLDFSSRNSREYHRRLREALLYFEQHGYI